MVNHLDERRRQRERSLLDQRPRCRDTLECPFEVDAAVLWAVRTEPARSLLELALASDPVAAAGLVPGDGDVDEPLEEVPLPRFSRTPGDLELLVSLEVSPGTDQGEPALK
jgi:hypothetical protein